MSAFRLYLRLIAFSLRGQFAYRRSFALQTLGQFLITGVEFLALWALMDRFGQIKGWRLAEVCFFYGTVNIMFSFADALSRGLDQFGMLVKSGEFDRILLRPRSTVLQLLGHELTLRRAGRFGQALLVLGYGFSQLPALATPANFLLLAWAMAGGTCLFLGILVLQATVCFWTVESIEMMNVLTYGGVTTAQYPLSIYEAWLRKFFLFVIPLAAVTFIPVTQVLGKGSAYGIGPATAWLSPLAGPVFLAVALGIWRLGVRRYCSTGS